MKTDFDAVQCVYFSARHLEDMPLVGVCASQL